jgi:integrase
MGSLYRRTQKLPDGTLRELPTIWIKYYQNGRAVRESTGTTKETVARRMLRRREGDVEHGIQINPKAERITFDEAADDLLNDYKVNGKRTYAHADMRLRLHLRPAFGGMRLLSITTAKLRAYVADRKDAGAAAATINRELAIVKRAFSLAMKDGKLPTRPYVPMLQENNTRKGFFERDQFDAVVKHLPAEIRPVVRFAHATGWRVSSEILPLEWRQVDWQGRVVRLDPGTTKNGEGRSFPFTAALETILKEQHTEHERLKSAGRIVPHVFHRDGDRICSFRGAWKAACKAAGVPGRILHDFRRTAVRNLERAGVPRSAAMAMVGHKTESIYRRYAIVDATLLREAAAKIDLAAGTKSGTTTGTSSDTPESQSA